MWFGSEMRVRKPECVKRMNIHTNEHVTLAKTIVSLPPFGLEGG